MATQYVSSSAVARAVPFDNTTNGFASSDVQAAIEEARSSISNPSLDQQIWVEKSGSDTTGTGTISKPFLTIGKAQTFVVSLGDASPTKRYVINVGPGDYNESLSLIANIFVKGQTPLATKLTGSTLDINHSSWNVNGADNRSGFTDMSVNPACTFNFDAQTNNNAGKLYFWNVRTSGAWTATANSTSSGVNQLIMHDSQVFGAISTVGCNTSIQDTTIQGVNLSVSSGTVSGQGNAGMTIAGGSTSGNLSATWTSNGSVTLNLRGLSIDSATTLTASGASCTVNAATDSTPVRANRTFSSSAVLNFLNDQNSNGIRSATTDVNTSAATAPTIGQALVATSSTAATWSSVYSLVTTYLTSVTQVSTTSGTYATISSMTSTPAAGTYIVAFNANSQTDGVNTSGEYALFLAGSVITETVRQHRNTANILGLVTLSTNNSSMGMTILARVTVNGSQVVDARFRQVTGGTLFANERTMIFLRVA